MRFEWDPKKSAANRRKHAVSFEEAQTVFFDDDAMLYDDPEDSGDEERFLLLGVSYQARVLVVAHSVHADGEVIRIISARRATKKERQALVRGVE